MIYIQKQEEPERYRRWRSRPEASYGKMKGRVRRELRNSLLTEQGFVCCFCGCAIGRKESDTTVTQIYPLSSDAHNIHNAHIIPQSVAPQLSLDYGNICASCDSSDSNEKHCDEAQRNLELPVTPLQEDCISFFSFDSTGTINANEDKSQEDQEKACQTIYILKLNSKILQEKRESMLQECMSIPEDYFDSAMENLKQRDEKERFAPFYFVALRYFGKI